ncbi:Predicted membrane protein [Polaromonas sp. JS666]|nr:Predicted membrane protein [Polaromonas sp. JS666]
MVTGSFLLAITLSLLEPTVQAFAFFFHEKAWQRWGGQRAAAAAAAATA